MFCHTSILSLQDALLTRDDIAGWPRRRRVLCPICDPRYQPNKLPCEAYQPIRQEARRRTSCLLHQRRSQSLIPVLVCSSSLSEPWTIIPEIQKGPGIIITLELRRPLRYPGAGGPRKVPTRGLLIQHQYLRPSLRKLTSRVDAEDWPTHQRFRITRHFVSDLLWGTC